MKNFWLNALCISVLAVILFIVGFIIIQVCFNINIDPLNTVLVFAGILATFVVITNFAQVAIARDEFHSKTKEFSDLVEKYEKEIPELREKLKNAQALNSKFEGLIAESDKRDKDLREILDTKFYGITRNTYLSTTFHNIAATFFNNDNYDDAFFYDILFVSFGDRDQDQKGYAERVVCRYKGKDSKLDKKQQMAELIKNVVDSIEAREILFAFLGVRSDSVSSSILYVPFEKYNQIKKNKKLWNS